jgi:hypothetical protein
LKSWIIEGSQDGENWQAPDRRNNEPDLDNNGAIATFSVRRIEQLRFIQLRQTELNHAGRHVLVVAAFDIFGLLFNSHFRPVSEDDGIVTFLSRQCDGSVRENNIVKATASTCIAGWDAQWALSESDEKS